MQPGGDVLFDEVLGSDRVGPALPEFPDAREEGQVERTHDVDGVGEQARAIEQRGEAPPVQGEAGGDGVGDPTLVAAGHRRGSGVRGLGQQAIDGQRRDCPHAHARVDQRLHRSQDLDVALAVEPVPASAARGIEQPIAPLPDPHGLGRHPSEARRRADGPGLHRRRRHRGRSRLLGLLLHVASATSVADLDECASESSTSGQSGLLIRFVMVTPDNYLDKTKTRARAPPPTACAWPTIGRSAPMATSSFIG